MSQLVWTGRDLDIMARTIYGEARGESFEGQVAVAWVIRHRAEQPKWWGHGVEGVCRTRLQFSCWNGEAAAARLFALKYGQSKALVFEAGVAALVLSNAIPDPTNGATHYMRIDILDRVKWDNEMLETARIGAHAFFKERAA